MDFALFLLLNATLFIRPAEIVPELIGLPIYNAVILLNLAVALPRIGGRLSAATFKPDPITSCVLGLLASIALSHASHLNFYSARENAIEFAKVVLYYLLLLAVLDTKARLRTFLAALAICVSALTALALLHYYEVVNIPSLDAVADRSVDPESGEPITIMRLCSTGIYHDPNDLGLILIVGGGVCLFLAGRDPGELPRPQWLVPAGFFLYALTLTHSKGGFIALLAAMLALFLARFGAKKAALLAPLALPAMFALFAGRQTSISASEGTGHERILLWLEGFALFRESPIFGIGQGLYDSRAGLVAHNSFIHAFAELGFLGGTLFLGAFAYSMRTLMGLGRDPGMVADPGLRRLRPVLFAIVVGYATGMLTITRTYVTPTYMILGIVASFLRLVAADAPGLAGPGGAIPAMDRRLVARMALGSLAFLVILNLLIKVSIRH